MRIFRRTSFRLGTRFMTVAAWWLTYNVGFIVEPLPLSVWQALTLMPVASLHDPLPAAVVVSPVLSEATLFIFMAVEVGSQRVSLFTLLGHCPELGSWLPLGSHLQCVKCCSDLFPFESAKNS